MEMLMPWRTPSRWQRSGWVVMATLLGAGNPEWVDVGFALTLLNFACKVGRPYALCLVGLLGLILEQVSAAPML